MRVATSTIYETANYNIQLAYSRVVRAQSELASGSRLQTAADNPGDFAQLTRVGQLLSENTQYRDASEVARNRLELEEGTLASMGNLTQRARELAVQLGNGTLSTSARLSIATEAEGLLKSMVSLANSQNPDGGRMFAGISPTDAPVKSFDLSGSTYWYYDGNDSPRAVQVSSTREMPTSSAGSVVFFDTATPLPGPVTDPNGNPVNDSVFATLQDLVTAAKVPAPTSVATEVASVLARITKFGEQMVTERAKAGAYLNEIESIQSSLEVSKLSFTVLKSELKDADLADAISRFTQQQTALEAAQKSFVRVQGLSLFNYL